MNKLTKYRFSDLYKMGSGISSTPAQAGHGYPFASFSTIFNNVVLPDELPDLMDTSNYQRSVSSICEGDILVTRTSETIDELAMSSVAIRDYPNATFSGFAKRLRPIQQNITYTKFMAFYMRAPFFRKLIDSSTIMTLRASFNENIFNFMNIYLPSYETQVVVGDFCYSIERKKIINSKIIDESQLVLNRLYTRWFVQFDFANHDYNAYKSSGGLMEFSKDYKSYLPKNWKTSTLFENELTSVIKPGVDDFVLKNYLATGNVDGSLIKDGNWVSYNNREGRANMQPVLNSVWFAKMKNSIKHITISSYDKWMIDKYVFSTGFLGLSCQPYALSYIHCLINSDIFEFIKNRLAHGATQEAINNEDLKSIKIIIPPKIILEEFNEIALPFVKTINNCLHENQELDKVKNFLLPLLINGQAQIKQAII